jgi:hypothetical protein
MEARKHRKQQLYEVAEASEGYFTAKQAEAAGYTRAHHYYHVNTGNWIHVDRGIYRLVRFPEAARPDLIHYSLWSRDRNDKPQGVYTHQTALAIHDLSDLLPSQLHMTVPRTFRKRKRVPVGLLLRYADLDPRAIHLHKGYAVTAPMPTILDLQATHEVPEEIIIQAIGEARRRGMVTERELEENLSSLPPGVMVGGNDELQKCS